MCLFYHLLCYAWLAILHDDLLILIIFHLKLSPGRKVAIDASMSIYQFLIAVRSDGSQLTNEAGEVTRCINDSETLCMPDYGI